MNQTTEVQSHAGDTLEERKRLIRLIHIAKSQLPMPEDEYRAILFQIGGKDSAALLTNSNLRRVVEHLKRCGFRVRSKPAGHRPLADDKQSRMIRGLWLELAQRGIVKNPAEAALVAFVKRHTGIEALQWLTIAQAQHVIEHLKQWKARYAEQQDGKGYGKV